MQGNCKLQIVTKTLKVCLQDTERLLLCSRHFATRSPLAAASRNTFSRQSQTKFESFRNNCCISRDCRLTGYFIINMWKCYLLFELTCIFMTVYTDFTMDVYVQ
jgi:hypothetical protein